jgi:hypothetical protein
MNFKASHAFKLSKSPSSSSSSSSVFHKFFEVNRHSTLKPDFDIRDSNGHDGFIGPI